MRRRWSWPILEVLRDTDPEYWVGAWCAWLVLGFVILVAPAMIVDTRGDNLYLGTYLLVALIVYGIPVMAGVLAATVEFGWFLLDEYGSKLIPRRVTEPVREDLRDAARRLPPGGAR